MIHVFIVDALVELNGCYCQFIFIIHTKSTFGNKLQRGKNINSLLTVNYFYNIKFKLILKTMFNEAMSKCRFVVGFFKLLCCVISRLPVLQQGLITLQSKNYLLISENLYYLNFVLYNAWFIKICPHLWHMIFLAIN